MNKYCFRASQVHVRLCSSAYLASIMLQNFLAMSEGAFRQHPVWANAPAEHQAQAIEVRKTSTLGSGMH